jgi:hypothetical protein
MSKHTPGLWFAMRSEREWIINQRGGPGYVCTVPRLAHRADECDANARLIAAAPALLKALQEMVQLAEETNDASNEGGLLDSRYDRARAAIASATGGDQ